eukprot:TRINITY_DN10484_c0_g1_i1.p1 TRINITY_DN10484_c0_g1~~TRINITY_DN10484_c0_g1_i1.p1  ORF type:complete len:328 (+),score=59.64 TRINITY_DN10484_c0_g1_i1:51-1034(+)
MSRELTVLLELVEGAATKMNPEFDRMQLPIDLAAVLTQDLQSNIDVLSEYIRAIHGKMMAGLSAKHDQEISVLHAKLAQKDAEILKLQGAIASDREVKREATNIQRQNATLQKYLEDAKSQLAVQMEVIDDLLAAAQNPTHSDAQGSERRPNEVTFQRPTNWVGTEILANVPPTSEEFQRFAKYFTETSHHPVTVDRIQRVQNMNLWIRYVTYHNEIKAQCDPAEKYLFHSSKNTDAIIREGLDERECDGIFGMGIYLGAGAAKSMNYGTRGMMFICRATLGKIMALKSSNMFVSHPIEQKNRRKAFFFKIKVIFDFFMNVTSCTSI